MNKGGTEQFSSVFSWRNGGAFAIFIT